LDIIFSILLGFVQGVAEFLPISSSGHLVVLQNLTNLDVPPFLFTLMLHQATLLSIVTVYRKEIKSFLKSNKDQFLQIFILVFSAMIPTVIMGLAMSKIWEFLYSKTYIVGGLFIFTGLILLLNLYINKNKIQNKEITLKRAIFIGFMQGVAALPGISRSGLTIAAALYCGVGAKKAGSFSFLISVPAILAATIYEFLFLDLGKASFNLTSSQLTSMVIASIVAYFTGVFSLKILLKVLDRGKLYYFAPYLFLVGTLTFFYFLR
jgi:undecaprenyl-diphosphatase